MLQGHSIIMHFSEWTIGFQQCVSERNETVHYVKMFIIQVSLKINGYIISEVQSLEIYLTIF